jgi:hypothetical protein
LRAGRNAGVEIDGHDSRMSLCLSGESICQKRNSEPRTRWRVNLDSPAETSHKAQSRSGYLPPARATVGRSKHSLTTCKPHTFPVRA